MKQRLNKVVAKTRSKANRLSNKNLKTDENEESSQSIVKQTVKMSILTDSKHLDKFMFTTGEDGLPQPKSPKPMIPGANDAKNGSKNMKQRFQSSEGNEEKLSQFQTFRKKVSVDTQVEKQKEIEDKSPTTLKNYASEKNETLSEVQVKEQIEEAQEVLNLVQHTLDQVTT